MMDLNLQCDPTSAFKQLDNIKRATPKIRKVLIRKVAVAGKGFIRKATYKKLKKGSGVLKKGLKHKVKDEDYGVLYQKCFYAGTHIFGKVIKPRKGKFLVFEINGEIKKVRSVTIPQRDFFFPETKQFFSSSRPVEIMQAALNVELAKVRG